ncbi:MAG: hypothetical protein WCP55_09415, partial [Lentisphaerota bacterium]
MALNPEWRRRIDMWTKAMPSMFFKPLGNIAFDGFVTKEQLTAEQALKGKFAPMPNRTEWGGKWEYGWFKGSVRLPKEAAGERIAMRVNVGGEAAIMINGMNFGANDIGHKEITLTRKAKGGETFDILVESYAGHGPRKEGGGPCPHGHEMVPEPPATQVKAGISAFGIWEEELFQLNYDMETLFQLRDSMADQESLRVAEIDDALMKATLIIDLELPRAEMLKTVRKGRELLKPLLEKKNGPTSPRMTCFGHSHIDVAWLWPLQETERKCCRTFSSQLALIEEYPEYKFLQSQPHLYQMVKTRYPALYQRIKKAVKSGHWIPDGGMWVEADTNISGGESLIRQFIHGKRFFRDDTASRTSVGPSRPRPILDTRARAGCRPSSRAAALQEGSGGATGRSRSDGSSGTCTRGCTAHGARRSLRHAQEVLHVTVRGPSPRAGRSAGAGTGTSASHGTCARTSTGTRLGTR